MSNANDKILDSLKEEKLNKQQFVDMLSSLVINTLTENKEGEERNE